MRKSEIAPLIVHIIYALKSGGLENGLVNIINRTPADRYRHAIICLTEADDFAERITAPNVEIVELHKKPGHDLGLYWRLWQALRALRPNIVHTRNFNSLEMQFLAFLFGAKRVHGEHGRDMDDLDGTNKKYNLFRRAMSVFVHRYIAVSKDLEEWLFKIIGISRDRIHQIYNGVDLDRFSHQHQVSKNLLPDDFIVQGSILVGTVGRLVEVKNQLSLIRAFSLCINHSPELADRLKLIIVGDGPVRDRLQQEVERLSLSDTVWLAGEQSDIPQWMKLMDVFVLPSFGEGISNTILEAMASGLPIIATRVGGSPELVADGENGLLVAVNDDKALADAIGTLVRDNKLRGRLASNSRQKIEKSFNWDKTLGQYFSLYDELLGYHPEALGKRCRH